MMIIPIIFFLLLSKINQYLQVLTCTKIRKFISIGSNREKNRQKKEFQEEGLDNTGENEYSFLNIKDC